MNSSVALSLLYSYSRYHRSSQRPADKDLVASLLDIIHSHLDGLARATSHTQMLAQRPGLSPLLLQQPEPLPRQQSPDALRAHGSARRADGRHASLLHPDGHREDQVRSPAWSDRRVDSDAERTITDALQRRYLASGDTSSRTVGIDCMLLRIDASVSLLFATHPERSRYEARRRPSPRPLSIEPAGLQRASHLPGPLQHQPEAWSLIPSSNVEDLDAPTVVSLVKRFAALCAEKKAVTPQDIAYTVGVAKRLDASSPPCSRTCVATAPSSSP